MLGALIAAVSPFDVARPVDGWTELHLRPLLLSTAALAALMLFVGRGTIDRLLALGTLAPVGGFAVASFASPDPATGLAVTVRVAVLGLIFVAAATVYRSAAERRVLVVGVAVGVASASVIGLVVLATGAEPWGSDLLVGSVSVTRGVTRLTRPFSHANVAAMYLAPAVVLVAGAVWRDRRSSMPLTAVTILGSIAVSLTLSRGGIVAFVLAMAGLALVQHRTRAREEDRSHDHRDRFLAVWLPLLTAALTIGVGVSSGRWGDRLGVDRSSLGVAGLGGPAAPSRTTIWGHAIDAWLANPLTGLGPGRFGSYSRSASAAGEAAVTHAHNPILETLATGGLVALAGVAVFGFVIVRRSRLSRSTIAVVPAGLSAAVVAAILPMVADHPFLFSSSGHLVALIGGAWYAAARPSEP